MLNWSLSARPAPRLLVLPVAASLDEAHAAIDLWEFYSGKTLDPTQRLTVEIYMACRDDGTWAAMTTGREMPRQNGKGDEIEVPEFWGMVKLEEAILHTVHDAVLLASQAQERMLGLFDHRDLRHLIDGGTVWKGTGQQMIRLSTGGQIWYRTRTGSGGRGVDKIDRLVVDEAQHATTEQLSAVTSTLMAAPDPQMNTIGTAGLDGKSAWWWSIRKRALSKDPGAFGYIGHTAENVWLDDDGVIHQEPPDVEDREIWVEVNPATYAGRGQGVPFLEEELWRLGPAHFAQEHLCVWAPPDEGSEGGTMPNWQNCGDDVSVIASDHMWAVATSPDRKWTTIGVAGRRGDGNLHVATFHRQAGTTWVIGKMVEYWNQTPIPVRIWKNGPESSFIAPLRERGVEVVEVSTAEVTQATGFIRDGVEAGTVRHPVKDDGGQSSLDRAVVGAVVRPGVDGASVWSQRSSQVEITPLVAVTVALGGVPQTVVGVPTFSDLGDYLEVEDA